MSRYCRINGVLSASPIGGLSLSGNVRRRPHAAGSLVEGLSEALQIHLGLLQRLNAEMGKTIIMVTHDPKAAEYATHTVHLDKGELADAPLAH